MTAKPIELSAPHGEAIGLGQKAPWTRPVVVDLDESTDDIAGGGGFADDGIAGFTDS